ncbi:MAG: hypothetical protein NQ127_03890 [Candidatus Cardinium sp.]|nr:hypothetical protein [Candidatus Cardinium sp.]
MQNLNFLKRITHLLLFSITILAENCDLGAKEEKKRLRRAEISKKAFRKAEEIMAEARRKGAERREVIRRQAAKAAKEIVEEVKARRKREEAAEVEARRRREEATEMVARRRRAEAREVEARRRREEATEVEAREAEARRREAEIREVTRRQEENFVEEMVEEARHRREEVEASDISFIFIERLIVAEEKEAEARCRGEAAAIAARVSVTEAEKILLAAEAAVKEKEAEACSVCLDQMDTEGQALKRKIYLPIKSKNVCAHAFHLDCLYEAIIKAKRERIVYYDLYDCSCAVCRTPIPKENIEAIICIYGKHGGSF